MFGVLCLVSQHDSLVMARLWKNGLALPQEHIYTQPMTPPSYESKTVTKNGIKPQNITRAISLIIFVCMVFLLQSQRWLRSFHGLEETVVIQFKDRGEHACLHDGPGDALLGAVYSPGLWEMAATLQRPGTLPQLHPTLRVWNECPRGQGR